MQKFQTIIVILLLITLGLLFGVEESEIGEVLDEVVKVFENDTDRRDPSTSDSPPDGGLSFARDDVGGGVEITFLNIGQGDATFIEFQDGQKMLIDCSEDARILEALGRVMAFYDSVIDYLVVTHPDRDHYGGCIDVLDRFEVKHIVYTGLKKDDSVFYHAFWDAVLKEQEVGAQYHNIDARQVWEVASTTIDFLYPDHDVNERDAKDNNTSIVMKLSVSEQDMLLTGDAEKEVEEYLIETYDDELDVEILKAGHHGSQSSSIVEFVSSTSPTDVVISSGADNRYGHPHVRVLKRFDRNDTKIWRTDTQGDILLRIHEISYDISAKK